MAGKVPLRRGGWAEVGLPYNQQRAQHVAVHDDHRADGSERGADLKALFGHVGEGVSEPRGDEAEKKDLSQLKPRTDDNEQQAAGQEDRNVLYAPGASDRRNYPEPADRTWCPFDDAGAQFLVTGKAGPASQHPVNRHPTLPPDLQDHDRGRDHLGIEHSVLRGEGVHVRPPFYCCFFFLLGIRARTLATTLAGVAWISATRRASSSGDM